jgi:hypothetical protein
VAPETEHPVTIREWVFVPRGLERYAVEQTAYAIGVHSDHPGIQAKIEYDQALNPRTVTLTAVVDGPNVTARLIRDYPIGAVDSAARSQMAWWWREYDRSRPDAARTWHPIPSGVLNDIDIRRPGRRGRPDLEYAEIARDYISVLHEAKPMKVLSDKLHLSASQVRNLLYEARRRGLLTKAPRGSAGGALTEKALALLKDSSPTPPRWTPEQLEEAWLRDEPFRELKRQLDAGEITAHEHRDRWNELITEIHGDLGDSVQVNSGKD